MYFFQKFRQFPKIWTRARPPQSQILPHCLFPFSHNFSFGVDFTPFSTQHNGSSSMCFYFKCCYLPWSTLTFHFPFAHLHLARPAFLFHFLVQIVSANIERTNLPPGLGFLFSISFHFYTFDLVLESL